ncbi:MAG: glycosyltransferase family 2 protein [Armatimonadetes bacterium]|nr:glycosyltransferase family 2 protein [Armatimonadota bacterium]
MGLVSIGIVNWNTRDHLKQCLESIRRNAPQVRDVVVVDNASSDGSADMVRREFPWVRLIANESNLGYAAGNNQVVAAARGSLILLLNPDTRVTAGAVEALVACMERHERAGAVAPRLIYPDGRLQRSCRSFPTPDTVLFDALFLSRLFHRSRTFGKYRMSWWDYDDERQVEQPMASALLLRRQAFEEAGGFDERFPIFFNDVDLCKRLWDAGWEIWFTPEAEIVHAHGASTALLGYRLPIESFVGFVRFYRKHYWGKINPLAYWGAIALAGLSVAVRAPVAALRAKACLRQKPEAIERTGRRRTEA